MKKVLILAYDFPPYVSVGGMRPYNWYRYLKEFDVEPIVVTRQWENKHGNQLDYIDKGSSKETIIETTEFGTIIRTPYTPNFANRLMLKYGEQKYRILRKSISAFYEFAQFIFPTGPKAELYRGAKEYLKNNDVDSIIATGDPFILFKYASKLSNEFNIPWIADYRDAWVQDKTRSSNFISRKWNIYFESRYLKNVNTIVTVSKFIQKQLEGNLKSKSYKIILNGFNPDVMEKAKNIIQETEIFTIAFAGTIYEWHPIDSFLKYCNQFCQQRKEIQVLFYGVNAPEKLAKLIDSNFPDLKRMVKVYPKIENEKLVELLAKANVFLLFNDYSILGTKIFTYLGLKRKILFCYSNDNEAKILKENHYNLTEFDSESKQLQADLINETNSGIIVRDSHHLLEVLKDLYKEFQATGQIACDSISVEKYSRKIQVEKLAELVKEMK
jgi:glycosyltransferase involved in cell wall biosynthesis